MKKALVILLLMVYGTSSFGMTVHFHYCCGKLKTVDFTPLKNNHCGSSKSYQMSEKPCCENKKVEMKVSGEQEFTKVFHAFLSPDVSKPGQQNPGVPSPVESKGFLPIAHAPPPAKASQPIYILNCVFRI